jgi:hypothetical protein
MSTRCQTIGERASGVGTIIRLLKRRCVKQHRESDTRGQRIQAPAALVRTNASFVAKSPNAIAHGRDSSLIILFLE